MKQKACAGLKVYTMVGQWDAMVGKGTACGTSELDLISNDHDSGV